MPYHPLLAHPLSRALAELSGSPEWKSLHRTVFNAEAKPMRVAWRNASKQHSAMVRSISRKRKVDLISKCSVASSKDEATAVEASEQGETAVEASDGSSLLTKRQEEGAGQEALVDVARVVVDMFPSNKSRRVRAFAW